MSASVNLSDLELGYTLAKQVPAIGRGFVLQTVYGDIHVPAGRLADRVSDLLGQHFRLEQMRREALAPAPARDRFGFPMDAPVIGSPRVPAAPRPASGPAAATCGAMPGEQGCVPGALASPQSTPVTAGGR